jgi:hypothetical protein
VNRVILCRCLGWPLEKLYSIPQDYGSVSRVRVVTAANGARGLEVQIPGLTPSGVSGSLIPASPVGPGVPDPPSGATFRTGRRKADGARRAWP